MATKKVKTMDLATKVKNSWKEGSTEKVDKFFNNLLVDFNDDIETANNNLVAQKANYATEIRAIDRKIEDAEDNLENAYIAIKPADVESNEEASAFKSRYLDNIGACTANLEELKKQKDLANEAYDENVKATKEQISLREKHIAIIQGK